MKKVINPNMIWGALDSSKEFMRLKLYEDDAHINAIAKYNAGMFLVILPKNKITSLTISSIVHYPAAQNTYDHFQSTVQKACFYTVVKAMKLWKCVDVGKLFNKTLGINKSMVSDTRIKLTHNLVKYNDISEIQINFPALGFVKELIIECDSDFEIKMPKPISTLFFGSSIGTFNFVEAHNSLPNYLYRLYGINTCSVALPKSHTFNCPKLMQRLLNEYKQTEKILVDLENLKFDDLPITTNYLNKIDCFIFKPSIVHHDLDKIIKAKNITNIFIANAEMCCDWGHPNVYGIVEYAKWLISHKKLVKETPNE